MHILFVTNEYETEKKPCGGLGHYIANISSILAKEMHKVTILIITNHNSAFEWKRNINVVAFKYTGSKNTRLMGECIDILAKIRISDRLNRSYSINEKIKEINKKCKIDIVQYCGDDLAVWYRVKHIPSVVRLSSFGPWYAMASQPKSNMQDMSWLNTWESKILLYSFTKADEIYGPSNFVAQIVSGRLKRNVKVIESPCLMEAKSKITDIPNEIQGKKYLLYYGRICTLKGIDTIREAIYDILNSNPQLVFVFVGYEVNRNVMKSVEYAAEKYQDRVLYLGEIRDREVLFAIVRNAYACVFPSRADNLPNTCIEAMGMGKVVIGTYGASFEQLIKHKENGLLIKRDSPKTLVKAVDYLMKMTEEEKGEMEEKAKERVCQMSPDRIYRQLITFYEEVIEGKKKRLMLRKG
jgi:Glycosyltransferase